MIVVALIGIGINIATALMFVAGSMNDINIRGAFLHMVADAAVSAGVVIAGVLILFTGWVWLDPTVSLAISAVIVIGTWSLLRDSINMTLHAVPPGIDPEAVRRYLDQIPGITAVHDFHIWPMSATETALTAHLVLPEGNPSDEALAHIAQDLRQRFGIGHSTLQVERGGEKCALAPEHAV